MLKTSKHLKIATMAIALGLVVGCEGTAGGKATASGGTRRSIKYKVDLYAGIRFIAAGSPIPNYNLIVQGYPYNRLLVQAYYTATDPSGEVVTTTPMQLTPGTQIPLTVTVGGQPFEYIATLTTLSSQPAGTYLLDALGAVQDVQQALLENPGAAVSVKVRTTSDNGGTAGALLPLAQRIYSELGSTDVVLDMDQTSSAYWGNLETTYVKSGPYTKTTDLFPVLSYD